MGFVSIHVFTHSPNLFYLFSRPKEAFDAITHEIFAFTDHASDNHTQIEVLLAHSRKFSRTKQGPLCNHAQPWRGGGGEWGVFEINWYSTLSDQFYLGHPTL